MTHRQTQKKIRSFSPDRMRRPEPLIQQVPTTNAASTNIDDNVGMTVIMPQEFFTHTESMLYDSCNTFLILSAVLGVVVVAAGCLLCLMTSRVHKMAALAQTTTLDTVIKDHHKKYGLRDFLQPPFQ
ncbi:hypothetical protein Pcinc_036150 [Petrolisthes cinctipes]|uniref:Uncharacterized protein n=1 Tax=Petrolisthes cinctipes TaxID=88211 RepID=A0AAE1BZF3_PETCI|nr:hypothetical protein Pcinc_036150 [Petrolisthes cinctipes]